MMFPYVSLCLNLFLITKTSSVYYITAMNLFYYINNHSVTLEPLTTSSKSAFKVILSSSISYKQYYTNESSAYMCIWLPFRHNGKSFI